MFLSRIPTLFLLFKLSAALKLSIQPTVAAGKDTPLNWTRESSDPQSFKFSLYLSLASGPGDNIADSLKNVDTDGKNQDSVNVDIPLLTPPGRYHILAFLSDSSDSDRGPLGKQQPDATTDPFNVVPLGVPSSRGTSTKATRTSSTIPVITILTPSDSDGTTTTPETITTTGPQGKKTAVTTLTPVPRPVSSSTVGTVAGSSISSNTSDTIPTSSPSQEPSGSTSSSNIPIIVGSIFGAILVLLTEV